MKVRYKGEIKHDLIPAAGGPVIQTVEIGISTNSKARLKLCLNARQSELVNMFDANGDPPGHYDIVSNEVLLNVLWILDNFSSVFNCTWVTALHSGQTGIN